MNVVSIINSAKLIQKFRATLMPFGVAATIGHAANAAGYENIRAVSQERVMFRLLLATSKWRDVLLSISPTLIFFRLKKYADSFDAAAKYY